MALNSGIARRVAVASSACAVVASLLAATPEPQPQLDELAEVVVRAKTLLPLEAFVEFPRYDSVVISPGGTRLATGWTEDNHDRLLTVTEFPSLKRIDMQKVQPGLSVSDVRWFSDRHLMVQPELTVPGFRRSRSAVGTFFIIDADKHQLQMVNADPLRSRDAVGDLRREDEAATRARLIRSRNNQPDASGGNPDRNAQGPLRMLAARTGQPDQPLFQTVRAERNGNTDGYGAFVMMLEGGKQSRVATLPVTGGQFVTGPDYRVALATGTSDRNEQVVYYLPPDARAAGTQWQLAVSSRSGERGLRPVAWTGTSEEYYALDGRGPTRAVAVWNAQTNTQRIVYRHPDVDMDTFALDPAGKAWMFSGHEHHPVYWYPDPAHPLARLHQSVAKRLPGELIEITSANDALTTAVVRVSSGRRAPVYIVMDVKTGASLIGMQAYPRLRGTRLAPVEAIEFRARDGLAIRGYLTTPTDADGKPLRGLPLVVIAHDGPQGEASDARYEFERQLFASRGYAVLQVNHRGSPGRGAAFERAGDGKWGREVQDDFAAGVQWAIRDGVAAADRVCFYGTRYGAYSALMAAARNPALFKCVIGIAGVYDLPALFDAGEKEIPLPLQQVLGNDMEDLKARSPVANAGAIKAKVLLMHQPKDDYSPTEQFTRMRLALQQAGNTPQQETIGQQVDGYFTPELRAAVYGRMLRFLEQNIGH